VSSFERRRVLLPLEAYDFHVGAFHEFRRRILVVDGNNRSRLSCSNFLRSQGYDVLAAPDGFAALLTLRGAPPDLLVTELNLPKMSGFELLSIVRTRFPAVGVIAISAEYTSVTKPHQLVCDVFLSKGPNLEFELLQEVEKLINDSPLRGVRPKSDVAPVWIPRSGVGYVLLTCPECLRSFPAAEARKIGTSKETCVFCGATVPFQIAHGEVSAPPALPAAVQSSLTRAKSRSAILEGRRIRKSIPLKKKGS